MRPSTTIAAAFLAATLITTSASACCISEYKAPRTQPLESLIRRITVLDPICSGTYDIAVKKRTCARRDRLIERVERMGWCWGSHEFEAPRSMFYWLPCRKNRN
ncbi:MAG TPA: hypothetical protein VGF77_05640 [Allosphingosinicella sp.]|jgi:hypothetical protein